MRSLKSKILALAVSLVVLTQSATIGMVLYTASREAQQSARDHLLRASAQLDAGLELASIGQWPDEDHARQIARLSGLETALIVDTGQGTARAIAGSVASMDLQGITAGLRQASDAGDGILRLVIAGREYLALRRPLPQENAQESVLLLHSLDGALGPYRTLRLAAIVLGVIALLLAMGGTAVVARAITQPVRQLADAMLRIRRGDHTNGVEVRSDDELGMLTAAFDTMQQDLAEREQRISYQAQFDALTGLPNRQLAVERIAQAIEQATRMNEAVSVLVIDLGNFTGTWAALGHDIGDALLAQAAERLRASVDARHMVARLEADQFLIALNNTGMEQAHDLAEDLLHQLEAGLSVRNVNISLNAAIGLAVYPEHARDADQLLQRATLARDDARAAHQKIHVYEEGREERRQRQLSILGDLHRAVRHDELKLYLQPKLALADGRVCGAEALARWDHPTLGWLPPAEFIGVAEQFGNISLITHWALTAAVRECRLWVEEGLDISVAVNLSSRDLLDRDLPQFILDLLHDHDLAPRYLTLEITEEALVHDFTRSSLVLQRLRDIGIRISIDDFGTGYSSLSQIKNLPVDEVKIDRSFITELPQNGADTAIVTAAIDLAHDLGLQVVAEGVETNAALRWLTAHGCETAQGFLISRPMPAEAFGAWVRHQARWSDEAAERAAVMLQAI